MARHTHLNLRDDVDDSVAGRAVGIEGRFGRTPMGSRDIGVSLWWYAPGFRAGGGHKHREQEEAYLVVSGSGEMLVDGEVLQLRQWDLVRVEPDVVRAFAAGPNGMEIVAVGGPKPEGGDGEQAPIEWPEES
jgi:quercetin dioxygenase-like cupin family protein